MADLMSTSALALEVGAAISIIGLSESSGAQNEALKRAYAAINAAKDRMAFGGDLSPYEALIGVEDALKQYQTQLGWNATADLGPLARANDVFQALVRAKFGPR
jgi:hypothetical protein